MFERDTAGQIANLWRESKAPSLTSAGRLERMIDAFLWAMRIIIDSVESVQKLWDGAGMAALMADAIDDQPLDAGGTVKKSSVYKYQVLFLAFKVWLNTPVSITISGQSVTLSETPTQLIMRQPEKVGE